MPEDNAVMEATDTRMCSLEMQWLVFVLDAICEGYLNTGAAASYPECPGGRPVHYDMAALCLAVDTRNERSIGLLPVVQRDDRTTGHGPYPNTVVYAETFNRIANAVNLLTHVPVELPWDYQHRTRRFEKVEPWDFTGPGAGEPCDGELSTSATPGAVCNVDAPPDVPGACVNCTDNPDWPEGVTYGQAYGSFAAPTPDGAVERSSASDLTWTDGLVLAASATCGIGISECVAVPGQTKLRLACDGGEFAHVRHTRWAYTEIRLTPDEESPVWSAVPAGLLPNIQTSARLAGTMLHQEGYHEMRETSGGGAVNVTCGGEFGITWDIWALAHNYTDQSCRVININDGSSLSLREELEGSGSGGFGTHLCPGGFDAFYASTIPVHAGGSNLACGFGGSEKHLQFTPVDVPLVVGIPLA
jgi:hypothetical protein